MGHRIGTPVTDPNILRQARAISGGVYGRMMVKSPYTARTLQQLADHQNTKKGRGLGTRMFEWAKSYANGVTAGIGDTATLAGSWLGSEKLTSAGMRISDFFDSKLGVEDPGFDHGIANAIGFMTSLLIPGAGVTKIGRAVNIGGKAVSALKVGGKAGALLERIVPAIPGAIAMSSLESIVEAGDQVERKIEAGMSPDAAFDEAKRGLFPNLAIGVAVNLPYFSQLGRLATATTEALLEGGQEMYQAGLDDWVMKGAKGGFPDIVETGVENWREHIQEGGIGGTIGFVFGFIFGRKAKTRFADTVDEKAREQEEQTKKDVEVEEKAATKAVEAAAGADVGVMAPIRDKYADMSDTDLGKAVASLQESVMGGEATEPGTVFEFAAAYEEFAYRANERAYQQLTTEKLKDMGRDILSTPAEQRTGDQNMALAYVLTELRSRNEITVEEVQKVAKKHGIPEQIIRGIQEYTMPAPEVRETPPPTVFDPDTRQWNVSVPMEDGSQIIATFPDQVRAQQFTRALQLGLPIDGAYDLAMGHGPGQVASWVIDSAAKAPEQSNLPVPVPLMPDVDVNSLEYQSALSAAEAFADQRSQREAPEVIQDTSQIPGELVPVRDEGEAAPDTREPEPAPAPEPEPVSEADTDRVIREAAKNAKERKKAKNARITLTEAQSAAILENFNIGESSTDPADKALSDAVARRGLTDEEIRDLADEMDTIIDRYEYELEEQIELGDPDKYAIGLRSRIRSLKRLKRRLDRTVAAMDRAEQVAEAAAAPESATETREPEPAPVQAEPEKVAEAAQEPSVTAEDFEPATTPNKERLAEILEELKESPEGAEIVTLEDIEDQTIRETVEALMAFSEALGTEAVLFKSNRTEIAGVYDNTVTKKMFINTVLPDGALLSGYMRGVVAHEVGHYLIDANPGNIIRMADKLRGAIRSRGFGKIRKSYKKYGGGDIALMHEITSRVLEPGAVSGRFWSEIVEELDEGQLRRMIRKLIAAFDAAVKRLMGDIETEVARYAGIEKVKDWRAIEREMLNILVATARAKGRAADVAQASARLAELAAAEMGVGRGAAAEAAGTTVDVAEAKQKIAKAVSIAQGVEDKSAKTGYIRAQGRLAKELAGSLPVVTLADLRAAAPKNWAQLRATVRRAEQLASRASDARPLGLARSIEQYLAENGQTRDEARSKATEAYRKKADRAQEKINQGKAVPKAEARALLGYRYKGITLDVIIANIRDADQGRGLDPYVVQQVYHGDMGMVRAFKPDGEPAGGRVATFTLMPTDVLEQWEAEATAIINRERGRAVKKNPNLAEAINDGTRAASEDAAVAEACWECAHDVLESRRNRDHQLDFGSDVPFRLMPLIDERLKNIGRETRGPRVSPAKPTDGPAMQEALSNSTMERNAADERRLNNERMRSLGLVGTIQNLLLDNLAGFRIIIDRALKKTGLPTTNEMGIGQSPYHTMRTFARSYGAIVERYLYDGVESLETPGKKLSKRGLLKVITDPKYNIAENYEQFGEYLVSKRLVAIFQAKPALFTSQAAKARLELAQSVVEEVESANPEWKQAGREISDFANGLVDFLVEVNLLSEADAKNIKGAYTFYAPLHLADNPLDAGHFKMDGKRPGMMTAKPIDRMQSIVGSSLFENPIEAMMRSTVNIVRTGFLNQAKINTANVINQISEKDPAVAEVLGEILDLSKFKRPVEKTRQQWYDIAGVRRKQGADIRKKLKEWEIDPVIIEEVMDAFQLDESVANEQKKLWFASMELKPGMVAYIEDGKFKVMRIAPEIYDAVSQMNGEQVNEGIKMIGAFTRLLRSGAVLSPEFMARNPLRDLVNAAVVSVGAIKKPTDIPRYLSAFGTGIAQSVKKGELYNRWVVSGGSQADLVAMDRDLVNARISKEFETATARSAFRHYANPRYALDALRSVSGVMEEATRLAVFKTNLRQNLDQGMPYREAELAAAFDSREASVDFARRGRMSSTFNNIIPFWNASLQGLDKLVRELGHPDHARRTAAWIRAFFLVSVPSIINFAINRDEEWYKALSRTEKNMYWVFKVGERVDETGKSYDVLARYPKPFELGLVFGSFIERMLEQVTGGDPDALKSWTGQLLRTVQPFQVGQAVPPISAAIMAANNTDTWRQREIVKGTLQSLPARLQYSENTTAFARAVGSMMDWAPLKVDYYIRSAFGGLGTHAADLVSAGITLAMPRFAQTKVAGRETIGPATVETPVLRAFFRSYAPGDYDTYTSDFFEHLENAEKYATELAWAKKGRIPLHELGRDMRNNMHWVALYKPLDGVAKQISRLTSQIKAVELDVSGSLTYDRRRELVQELSRQRGELTRQAVEQVRGVMGDDALMARLRAAGERIAAQGGS